MLTFEEAQRLNELKKTFSKKVGALKYEFSDSELRNIYKEVQQETGAHSEGHWHDAIRKHTPIREFGLFEALDNSDIDLIAGQIMDLLNKK